MICTYLPICFIAFHSWLFTILPHCSFLLAMILPHCSSCFHDLTIFSMFFLLFPTCSMAFFEKKTPPSLLRHPLCFSVSLHAGGVQQAPAERATTGGATKALRKAVSAEPWKRETMVGRRGFPHTLWLCQNSYWKWPFLVDFPIKHGDFSIVMLVYHRVMPI